MTIDKISGLFVLRAAYHERYAAREAGFRWHNPDRCKLPACVLCESHAFVWWSDDPATVARLSPPDTTAVDASRADDADIVVPLPDGMTLLPFQRAGIKYATARRNTLIADEMGLGKTVQALGVLNVTGATSVLVVCPATLRLNWKREAERWSTRAWNYHIVADWTPVPAEADFVVINYDRLVGARAEVLFRSLVARQWDTLILDEAHFIKSRDAKRTRAVTGYKKTPGLIASANRIMFLTGTPITNRPVELWPLLHALDPERWRDFWAYAMRYCAARHRKWGWDFTGASNLDELQARLRGTIMVRRLKRDVLTELPAKRRQVISVPPNGTAKIVEAENTVWRAWKDRLDELEAAVAAARDAGDEDGYNAAVDTLREARVVAFHEIAAVRHDTAVAKVPYVSEHLDDLLLMVPKVVVFAHHKDVVKALVAHFGDTVVSITGDTPQADRQGIVDRFQSDDTIKVFIGSTTAAGVGITLTAASTVVFAELDWVPANVSQAEDRCHRIGQQDSVLVQHVVIDGSLDARMAKTLIKKQSVIDSALDSGPLDPFHD